MCAQPQYQVEIVPPATVTGVVGDFNITLCFRDANSTSAGSATYCPLGMITVSSNVTFSAKTLELGMGGDQLPARYPEEGIEVLLRVDRVGMDGSVTVVSNGSTFLVPVNLGELVNITKPIQGGGFYDVHFLVDCIAGYTGVDCNELEDTPTSLFTTTTIGKR